MERIEGRLGEHHSGALREASSRRRAERIVAEELRRLGWTELDLAARRKNAPEKLPIATRLRKETTLTVKDIAALVHLGTSKTANAKLHQFMKTNLRTEAASPLTKTEVGL